MGRDGDGADESSRLVPAPREFKSGKSLFCRLQLVSRDRQAVGDVSLRMFATKPDVKWIPHWTKLASAES